MPRYKLTIAYDGTDFCGWQKQEPFQIANSKSQIANKDARGGGAGNGGGESLESFDPKGPTPPVPRVWDEPASPKGEIQGIVQRTGEDRPRVQLRTVQHVVERAVREIVHEPVSVLGASRTDAGVHARGQVAAFSCAGDEGAEAVGVPPRAEHGTASVSDRAHIPGSRSATVRERAKALEEAGPGPLPDGRGAEASGSGPVADARGSGHAGWPVSRGTDRLIRAINGRLPDDVVVLAAEAVAGNFDPVTGAVAKAYSYTLHVSRARPVWDRRYVHQIWDELDLARMREGAARIVGEHDFAGFAAAGHGRLTTVRTVFSCEVVELAPADGARRIRIDVSGSGFLYNMVRIIAGTLVECGRGRMSGEDVARAIEGKDRKLAGPTLPASGLCLEWIRYAPAL